MELTVEEFGPVQVWTINGEARRNTLSQALVHSLEAAVLRAREDFPRIRAIVLRGQGDKAFCAGADLKERLGMGRDDIQSFLLKVRSVFRGLEQLPQAVIAYVNGAAFGGGLELAMACDLRVCAPQSTMALTETQLAIIPGAGGTQRLTRLVGVAKAKSLILQAKKLDADAALQCGLVEQIGSMDEALSMAQHIAKAGPLAIQQAKKAIDGGWSMTLDDALEHEWQCYVGVLDSEDRLEGLKSFQEKRPPVYRGR